MNSIKYTLLTLSILLSLGTGVVFAETTQNNLFDFSSPRTKTAGRAVLTIDKSEYAVGETVNVSGYGFGRYEVVALSIETNDASLKENVALMQWNVFADAKGRINVSFPIDSLNSLSGRYVLKATGTKTGASGETTISSAILAIGVDIEQCGNGPLSNTNRCNIASGNDGWTRGNLNESKSHYLEGDSVPIRIIATGLTVGQQYTVTIGYDFTKGGKYATDYITDFDRTENVDNNPCTNVAGCSLASEQNIAVPTDPQVTAGFDGILGTPDDITQIGGSFSIFGGTFNGVSGYTLTGAVTGDSTKLLTLTFTPTSSTVVIAYGSHISTRTDWGTANSAINITGSPYHNFVQDFPGANSGNRDLQLSATAVVFPATITIIKDAQPNSCIDFSFTGTGPGVSNFMLDDDAGEVCADGTLSNTQTFTNLTNFGLANAVTITEQTSNGSFTLVAINCTSQANGGSGINNNTINVQSRFAQIVLEEGESVTCTFVNAIPTAAAVSVSGSTLTESGMPLARTLVTLQNVTTGETQSVYTNTFGHYQFDGLLVGDFYIVTVNNRKYTFEPNSQAFTLSDAVEGLNFTAVNP
jgi:hypothetical protein